MEEITKGEFRIAAWLSIINAVLTVPVYFLGVISYFGNHPGIKAIYAILMVIALILLIAVFLALQKALNVLYNFHDVDTYISAFLVLNAIATVIDIIFVPIAKSPRLHITAGVLCTIASIICGVALLIFAIKVLSFKENIVGLLRPFAYAILAQAICMVTVVLTPFALFASVAADVILALLFFRLSEQLSTAA